MDGLAGTSFAVMAETQRPDRREQGGCAERTTLESFADNRGRLIKHLRWAEYGWFDQLLQERSDDNRRTHDRSRQFEFLPDESLPTRITEHQTLKKDSGLDLRPLTSCFVVELPGIEPRA